MDCFSWCGTQIDWEAWSAIGSLLSAIAAAVAAVIALHIPASQQRLAAQKERVLRDQRRKEIATMIYPTVRDLYGQVKEVKLMFEKFLGSRFLPLDSVDELRLPHVEHFEVFVRSLDQVDDEIRLQLYGLVGWAKAFGAWVDAHRNCEVTLDGMEISDGSLEAAMVQLTTLEQLVIDLFAWVDKESAIRQ